MLTGVSEKGSNCLSSLRMKSGFSRYPQLPLYSNLPFVPLWWSLWSDHHCDQIIIVIRSSLWSDVNFVMESLLLVFTRVIQTWLSCIGRSGVWKFSDTSWKIVHQDHHWHYKGCVDDQKRESYVPGTQIKKVKVMYLAPRVPENLWHEVRGVCPGTLVNNVP